MKKKQKKSGKDSGAEAGRTCELFEVDRGLINEELEAEEREAVPADPETHHDGRHTSQRRHRDVVSCARLRASLGRN